MGIMGSSLGFCGIFRPIRQNSMEMTLSETDTVDMQP